MVRTEAGGEYRQGRRTTVGAIFEGTAWAPKVGASGPLFDIDGHAFARLSREDALALAEGCGVGWVSTVEAMVWAVLLGEVDPRYVARAYSRLLRACGSGAVCSRKTLWRSTDICSERLVGNTCWGVSWAAYRADVAAGGLFDGLGRDASSSASPASAGGSGLGTAWLPHLPPESYFLVMAPGDEPEIWGLFRSEESALRAASAANGGEGHEGRFRVFAAPVCER